MLARGGPSIVQLFDEASFDTLLASERVYLVRFCAHLTGNRDAAEDLAQEALLEAWRNQHKLSVEDRFERTRRMKWLTAIARNVCLRWGRSYGRDLAHLAQYSLSAADDAEPEMDLDALPAGAVSLDIELEREELAQLLDRALALLPPVTRTVLIERYIHESSHAEIAGRLGLKEDALVQRLYRGKLALRQVMERDLNEEAASYGLVTVHAQEKQRLERETRIWCPFCNTSRIIQYSNPVVADTGFVCPACWQLANLALPQLWKGIHSPKSILNRQLAYLNEFYWGAITHGETRCPACDRLSTVRVRASEEVPEGFSSLASESGYYGISIRCLSCGFVSNNALPHLSIDLPQSQQFWCQHGRMLWLPAREIAYAGQSALLSGFQSASDSARLEIIYQRSTLKVLGIHETSR